MTKKSKARSKTSGNAKVSTTERTKARARGESNDKVESPRALPPFEPKYLMRVNAPGVSGEISDGDLVLLTRDEMPKFGEVACVHTKSGSAVLVTLNAGLCEIDWKRMPFELSARDECVSLVMGTVLGSTKQFTAPMDKLLAIHKCEGRYESRAA